MDTLVIDGSSLTIDDVVQVARYARPVALAESARIAMEKSRAVVEVLLENDVPVYGLTTGFGSKRNVFISREDARQLQWNLIRSHASGTGDPLPEDVVRAALLLRANALARGMSGVRVQLVERIVDLLNRRIYPYVPTQGSVSASGDLAPLAHLALVIAGDEAGRIYGGERVAGEHGDYVSRPDPGAFVSSTPENLRRFGYEPIELEAKEGLGLTNGVQVATALGMMVFHDLENALFTLEGAAAMSIEAIDGVPDAFDSRIHAARPHPGQAESASTILSMISGSYIIKSEVNTAWIRKAARTLEAVGHVQEDLAEDVAVIAESLVDMLKDADALANRPGAMHRVSLGMLSEKILDLIPMADDGEPRLLLMEAAEHLSRAVPKMPRVQDDYSFRCAPQVHGAVRDAMQYARRILETEANSATDNPLVFPPDGPDDPAEYRKTLKPSEARRAVKSGGNFHGEPVAFALDHLALAASELGSISERRVSKVVDGRHNEGLPSLLVDSSGLNSGFMIPQYTAASLVSENKSLVHPASADSIPTCENTEDHVSMALIGGRKAAVIVSNLEKLAAIELLTAYQALHFRPPFTSHLGRGTSRIFGLLKDSGIPFVDEDRSLEPLIADVTNLVRSGRVAAIVRETASQK